MSRYDRQPVREPDPARCAEAGADAAGQIGEVVAVQVIPRPHDDLSKLGNWIN